MKILKFILFILLAIIFYSPNNYNTQANEREAGGDYGNAHNVLKLSQTLITIYLSKLSDSEWDEVKESILPPNHPNHEKTFIALGQVDKEYLIFLIKNMRANFTKKVGIKFMNWNMDTSGEIYLEALNPYYLTFDTFWNDIDASGMGPQTAIIAQSMQKILKEASHTWGNDDAQGEEFARNLVKKLQNSYPVPVYKSAGRTKYNRDIIPPYAIKRVRLASGNLQLYKCNVTKLSIKCPTLIGDKAGFSQAQLEKYDQSFRLQGKRYIYASAQSVLMAASTVLILVTDATCIVGGFAAGLKSNLGFGMIALTGLAGVVCAYGVTTASADHLLSPLGKSIINNYTNVEMLKIAEMNDDDNVIYYFYQDIKSIDEVEAQVIRHEGWFSNWGMHF